MAEEKFMLKIFSITQHEVLFDIMRITSETVYEKVHYWNEDHQLRKLCSEECRKWKETETDKFVLKLSEYSATQDLLLANNRALFNIIKINIKKYDYIELTNQTEAQIRERDGAECDRWGRIATDPKFTLKLIDTDCDEYFVHHYTDYFTGEHWGEMKTSCRGTFDVIDSDGNVVLRIFHFCDSDWQVDELDGQACTQYGELSIFY